MVEDKMVTEKLSAEKLSKQGFFQDRKSAAVRIWHWLTFILMVATITMVLLSETLFHKHDNVKMIQDMVHEKGGLVTVDQAKNVAHEYNDKLWMVHKYIGFALSFLLLSRIVIEIAGSKEEKLMTKINKAVKVPSGDGERNHYLAVEYSYLIFYLLFTFMALTGLVLAFEDVSWLDPLHRTAKNIHSVLQYFFYAYIFFHLAGTIRADMTKYSGIISRMINGKPGVGQV